MYLITHCQLNNKKPIRMGGYFLESYALEDLTSRVLKELVQSDSNEDTIREVTNYLRDTMDFLYTVRINSSFRINTAFGSGGVRIEGSRDKNSYLQMVVRIIKPDKDSSDGIRKTDIIIFGWSEFGDLSIAESEDK